MEKIVYTGLDVHAHTIAVALAFAIADDGRNGEIRFHGAYFGKCGQRFRKLADSSVASIFRPVVDQSVLISSLMFGLVSIPDLALRMLSPSKLIRCAL